MSAPNSPGCARQVDDCMPDFDLHGVVGIRLVDATAKDIALVRRQLGPLQRPLHREPDITVRFVDQVTTKPLTHVSMGETSHNEDGFFVHRGQDARAARALLPFGQIGHRPQIVCERGINAVPHLLAIINLTALGKGVLPLHATAFTLDGTGVLVTGWSKAGKTESLLAAMDLGAQYVGDEWIYLTEAGDMLGLPEPIRLWSWHLQQVPLRLRARPRRDRVRLSIWRRSGAAARRLADTRLPGADLVRKGAPAINRQAYLQIPPEELFGAEAVTLRGHLDAVVLVVNHESPEMAVETVPGSEIADRMAASLETERAAFTAHYLQFRYAFPAAANDVVEAAPATEARLLSSLFADWTAAMVSHPYPCDIAALGRAVLSGASMCHPAEPTPGVTVTASAIAAETS